MTNLNPQTREAFERQQAKKKRRKLDAERAAEKKRSKRLRERGHRG